MKAATPLFWAFSSSYFECIYRDMYALPFPTSYVKTIVRDALKPFGIEFAVLTPTEKSPVISSIRELEPAREYLKKDKRICPSPLGSKIETFEGIIRSYLTWAEHIDLGYSIHAEEFERLHIEDPESVQALIKSIKDKGGPDDQLLDAQIFLELALISDIQHDSLDQTLNSIEEKESLLYNLIDGASRLGDQSLKDASSPRLPPISQPKKRILMWAKLLSNLRQWDYFDLFLGEGREMLDLMEERYARRANGMSPTELIQLFLAPHYAIPPHVQEEIQGLFSQLIQCLSQADINNTPTYKAISEELRHRWKQVQPRGTPLTLTIFQFKGVDIVELLLDGVSSKQGPKGAPSTEIAVFIQ